jgi:hypothetical protein
MKLETQRRRRQRLAEINEDSNIGINAAAMAASKAKAASAA